MATRDVSVCTWGAESGDPARLVPIVDDPYKIMIAVAEDPDRTNAEVFADDGPHSARTAKRVDRTPPDDLVCRIGHGVRTLHQGTNDSAARRGTTSSSSKQNCA